MRYLNKQLNVVVPAPERMTHHEDTREMVDYRCMRRLSQHPHQ